MAIRDYKLNIMFSDTELKQLEKQLIDFEMTVSNYIRLILKYSDLSKIPNLTSAIDQFDELTIGTERNINNTVRLSKAEKDILDAHLLTYNTKASKLVRFLLFAPSHVSVKINFPPL